MGFKVSVMYSNQDCFPVQVWISTTVDMLLNGDKIHLNALADGQFCYSVSIIF